MFTKWEDGAGRPWDYKWGLEGNKYAGETGGRIFDVKKNRTDIFDTIHTSMNN